MRKWNPYADLIITNAKIYTVDISMEAIREGKTDFPIIQKGFVAVKDGKIIEVGEGTGAELVGEETRQIDAKGKTLIPGLLDSHAHAVFAGLDLNNIDMTNVASKEEFLAKIKERVDITKEGEWVKAREWNELNWDIKEQPTCREIDAVCPDKPFIGMRLCGHVVVVNSTVLKMAGIDKDTPDPEGGIIGRYEDGNPNGLFYEIPAIEIVKKLQPEVTRDDIRSAIISVGKLFHRVGLTGVIDCNISPEQTRIYNELNQNGELKYRANITYYIDEHADDWSEQLLRIPNVPCSTGLGDDMLWYNGLKIVYDGIPASGTALMRDNYIHMPETNGLTIIPKDEMIKECRIGCDHNWQIAIHSIGDKSIDDCLDAIEEGMKVNASTKLRHYLIHANFPRPEHFERMRKMNVSVTVQPTIFHKMGEQAILDEDKGNLNTPCSLYFKEHIITGGSTDFPVVDANPFIGMYGAVTRYASDGKVYGEEYKATKEQALLMWTRNSAYIMHREDVMGSIAPGYFADLVLVDTDFLNGTDEELRNTKVLMTMVGGDIVYEA